MPDKRRSGFSSAAGLIQYYDMEESHAPKLSPYLIMAMGLVAAVFIEFVSWRFT
ncbi:MAG: preprotein translocase subunit Sec61beta [Thermoplasmata archaeon]|jgi:preprotein translocase subunit Sec61beta